MKIQVPPKLMAALQECRQTLWKQRERSREDVGDLLSLPPLRQQCRILHPRSRLLNRPTVEELLRRAHSAGFKDGTEAQRICQLAWEICIWMGGRPVACGPREVADLKALTAAHWGNASRILCDWQGAESRFKAAYEYLSEGSGDPMTEATVLSNHASLLRDLGQLEKALTVLERAGNNYQMLGESHLLGQVLLNRADVLRLQGEPDLAFKAHLRACGRLDEDRDPHLTAAAWVNLAVFCCSLGRYREAWSLLESCPDFSQICGPQSTVLLNHAWVTAKALHGLGRFGEAEESYRRASHGFEIRRDRYNMGLVRLDMALLFTEQGMLREVETSAMIAYQALSQEPLEKDARAALQLFMTAIRQKQALAQVQAAWRKFWQVLRK